MHSPFARSLFVAVLGVVAFAPLSRAITIRDDVPDSSYIALGADPAYQAAGSFDGGSWGGTLIADPFGLDQYVLTSTHLIQAGLIVPGMTHFTIGGNVYNVASYVSAPNYNPSTLQNDLTIVRLSSSVTGVTPVAYYTGTAELHQTITAIGYGLTGTGLTGGTANGGQRRGANNVIDVLDATTLSSSLASTSYLFDFDNPAGTSNSLAGPPVFSSATALPLEGNLSSGDSGGGDFAVIGGTLYLVGVHSYIIAPNGNADAGNPIGLYGDVSGSTRVSDFSSFIAQNVPEPGSASLLVGGVVLLGGLRRRQGRAA